MSLTKIATLLLLSFAVCANAQEAPRLEIQLDREYYLQNHQNNLYLKAVIQTGSPTIEEERPAANFVFLVDRSGSMEGENLTALKNALRLSFSQLSSRDRLTVVAFGSSVETLLPPTPIDQVSSATAIIENILTEGGSALQDGLLVAAEEVRKHSHSHTYDHIFLFLDGPPNKGARDTATFAAMARELAAEDIGITTFGIGNTYPEELLYRLAEPSGSRLHSASNVSDLSSLLASELETFHQSIAHNALLEIEFDSSIEIVESIGRQAETTRRSAIFRFDKLVEHQELTAIVQATISPSKSSLIRTRIVEARLTLPSSDPSKPPIILEETLYARFTPSNEHSFETIRPGVYQSVCNAEVADTIRESIEAHQDGRSTKAVRELKRLSRNIRSVADRIPDLQIDAPLDQLNLAIDSIEQSENPDIDRRALMNTLYKTTRNPESRDLPK